MIASYQTLKRINKTTAGLAPLSPFEERTRHNGFTYGLGPAGYDIRIAEEVLLNPGDFRLASSMERFMMPNNLLGVVHDKSTWARLGLCVQNTVIEPGWEGFLTLELTNHQKGEIWMQPGTPICQVIFHILDESTEYPYEGKYQNQKQGVQEAILEPSGLLCPICRLKQFNTPSGMTCPKGHGGEVGIEPDKET